MNVLMLKPAFLHILLRSACLGEADKQLLFQLRPLHIPVSLSAPISLVNTEPLHWIRKNATDRGALQIRLAELCAGYRRDLFVR